jgi:hypothetical protein
MAILCSNNTNSIIDCSTNSLTIIVGQYIPQSAALRWSIDCKWRLAVAHHSMSMYTKGEDKHCLGQPSRSFFSPSPNPLTSSSPIPQPAKRHTRANECQQAQTMGGWCMQHAACSDDNARPVSPTCTTACRCISLLLMLVYLLKM